MKQVEALRKWNPSDLPKWLDENFYRREVLPRLSELTVRRIRIAIDVSHPYATLIRLGERVPHPRHWMRLAGLAGVSGELPSAEHSTQVISDFRRPRRPDTQGLPALVRPVGFRARRVVAELRIPEVPGHPHRKPPTYSRLFF
jgi:hypothetical protein